MKIRQATALALHGSGSHGAYAYGVLEAELASLPKSVALTAFHADSVLAPPEFQEAAD